jgi:GTP-binding protein HflX
MPNRQKVLFIDTVGFLDHLPHHLIEAFKATLEEVVEADILLHLVDASHPKAIQQANAVYRVLEEIGARDKVIITALNKIDKIKDKIVIERMRGHFDNALAISALTKEGFEGLIATISSHISSLITTIRLDIPQADTKTLNLIYENGLVLKKEYEGDIVHIEAEVPIRIKEILEKA